jgi:hypothetical protein
MATVSKKEVSVNTKSEILASFALVIQEATAEFDANKAQQAADWNKELARQKEEDNYNFNIAKRDREEALKNSLATRVLTVSEREDKVKVREVTIGDAEKTIADLQGKVDSIPAIAAKAEATGFGKGAADAKKESDGELRITKAENDANTRISDNKISTLEGTVASQEAAIKSLREELASANARVQEIATNAVTAAGQSQVTVNTAQSK